VAGKVLESVRDEDRTLAKIFPLIKRVEQARKRK